MKKVTSIAVAVLIAAFAGSVLILNQIEGVRGKQATLEEVLYIPSGRGLKRMSLGYSGVLADIYWTRAVQYYGRRLGNHDANVRYDLLYPLLDITTDLDPHLLIAYEFGSIFLAQKPPVGAGKPDKAVELVEKGIRANPDNWRLYFTLAFTHYFDRKDYKAAALAFQRGSERPGGPVWMKGMAATMAQRANDPETSLYLWTQLYQSTDDKLVRQNAQQHMIAIRVDREVLELERRVTIYLQRNGHLPSNWYDLVRDRLLGRIPFDPTDRPYKLMPDGSVQVENPDDLPFITQGLPLRSLQK